MTNLDTGTERQFWRDSLGVGLTALILRLAHLLSLRSLPTFESHVMDEAYQVNQALALASGNWIGDQVFFRAPLHTYFLGLVFALFGQGGLAPRLVQILIGAASVVILHRIALRMSGRGTALVAALLMALCWPLIYFDNELLITVLEVSLSLSVLLLLLRADGAAGRFLFLAAGLVLGLAAIARPNMLLFAPAAALWIALAPRGRHIGRVLLFAAGLLLPILPVTARNLFVGDDIVLISSQGGVNFFIGNNPLSDGTTAVVPGTRPTWEGGYLDSIETARHATGAPLKPSGVSRYWFRRGLAFWQEEPVSALALFGRKLYLFASGLEISNNKDIPFFRSLSPVLSLPLPSTFLLAPLGLVGWGLAWRDNRARRRLLALPLLFALTYGLSIVVFFVTSRYRMPVLPIWALGTAFLVEGLRTRAVAGKWKPLAVTGLVTLILIIILNMNPTGYRSDPGHGHLILGLSHQIAGHPAEAMASFDRAIEAGGPYLYEAWHRKGEVLVSEGRLEEAIDALEESLLVRPENPEVAALLLVTAAGTRHQAQARAFVLRLDPEDPSSVALLRFTVGSFDQALGNNLDAEKSYRAALAFDPDHTGTLLNLALLLRASGRVEESFRLLLRADQADDNEPLVHLNLAKHYLFVGDVDQALEHVRRVEQLGGVIEEPFRRVLESTRAQVE